MFTLKKTRITTDQGYEIDFGRDRLVYSTDHYTVSLNHEMLPEPKSIAIWRESVQPINVNAYTITSGEYDTIVGNVVRAFREVGYHVVVIE